MKCEARKLLVALTIAVFSVALFAQAEANEPTRVNITSQPSGATVVVDGKDRGTTPILLFDLAPGRHHVKFRMPGYIERDRFFTTGEGPFIEKNEQMIEEKGLLLIKTEPEGCDIAVDGVSIGSSPRLITHLTTKDVHSIRLRKSGYLDQLISVKFDGRKPIVREEKMVLSSGVIDVMSEPVGAEVTVNGIVRGKTPLKVADVPKGRAVVKFHLNGFEDEVRELAINAGDVQTLPVVLKGLPGTLHLTSVPDGARFYVNNQPCGKSPVVMTGMKPGEYQVRAEADGFGIMNRTIVIENGQSASEEFRLSNVMGRLEIKTSPVGCKLTIDGRFVGVTSSNDPNAEFSDVLLIENLLEGEHNLVVTKDGYAESVRHPKIQRSKTSQHKVRLRRLFIPNIEIVTSRGTYRGVLVSQTQELITIEVKMGITQSFLRDEIRKIDFLEPKK